jgi:hypothetical protein
MPLISFDASERQLSKLKKGHKVRIKKGTGFNLVINPSTYQLVARAFTKNKGVEVKLSPEELDANKVMNPEQHAELSSAMDKNLFSELPFAEGGSIFGKIKKFSNSKAGKDIGRVLKPASRLAKAQAKEYAHQKISEAHQYGADNAEDPRTQALVNAYASQAHSAVQNPQGRGFMSSVKKGLRSKTAKDIGRVLKPASRLAKAQAKEYAHQQIASAHQYGADNAEDPRTQALINAYASQAHSAVQNPQGRGGYPFNERPNGQDMRQWKDEVRQNRYGGSLGASVGAGHNAHTALRLANLATARANHMLASAHNAAVHGQRTQPVIGRYWDGDLEPPSRGAGHFSGIFGRGTLLSHNEGHLPPALQSQPYGANFHMQFFLPPEYKRYNDGGVMEGSGLYA